MRYQLCGRHVISGSSVTAMAFTLSGQTTFPGPSVSLIIAQPYTPYVLCAGRLHDLLLTQKYSTLRTWPGKHDLGRTCNEEFSMEVDLFALAS